MTRKAIDKAQRPSQKSHTPTSDLQEKRQRRRDLEQRRKSVLAALERFDFVAAVEAFTRAGYEWGFKPRASTPTTVQLRLLAIELLEAVSEPHLDSEVVCGGLKALRHDNGTLELALCL